MTSKLFLKICLTSLLISSSYCACPKFGSDGNNALFVIEDGQFRDDRVMTLAISTTELTGKC